jgi:hypothetical protein
MGEISVESASRSEMLTGYDAENLAAGRDELDHKESINAPDGQEFRAVQLRVQLSEWAQVGLAEGTDARFWIEQIQLLSVTTQGQDDGTWLTQPVNWTGSNGSMLTLVLLVDKDAGPEAATFELEVDGKVQQLSLITGELLQDADGTIGAATAGDFSLRDAEYYQSRIDYDDGYDVVTGEVTDEYDVTTAPYSEALGWPDDGATYIGVPLRSFQYYEAPGSMDIQLQVQEIEGELTLDDGTKIPAALIEPATAGPRGDTNYVAWFAVPADFDGGDLSFRVTEVFPRTDDLNEQLDPEPFTARLEAVA